MADAPRDANRNATIQAVSDLVSTTPINIVSKAATGAMYVHVDSSDVSFGGGTQYVVDDALGSTPTGTLAIAIRDDALSTLTPVEGDAIGLRVDSTGALWTTISGSVTVASHAVTNAGTFVVQENGAALTALQLIDDSVATFGTTTYTETSTKGLTIGAVRRDADTTLVDTTNEIGPLQMNAAGQLKVEVFSGETLPVSLTSTTVTGTVAVTQSGIWDEVGINDSGNSITVDYATTGSGTATGALRVELPTNGTGVIATVGAVTAITNALPAGTNNIGDVDVLTLPALPAGTNNIGDVDILSIVPGTGATNLGKAEDAAHTTGDTGVMFLGVRNESFTSLSGTDGDYTPIFVDQFGRVEVVADNATGNIGHDSADSGNPVKVGGQARTTNPTAVADADRVNFIADDLGKQVVVGSIRDLKVQQVTTITSSTAETTIGTAVASTFLDLYGLIITNTSATAVNVAIKDSTAGTTRLNIAIPAGDTRGFMLNESAAHNQATVNNNWTATSSGSVASLVITAFFVKNI